MPSDPRHAPFLERCPSLRLIGRTPMVRVDALREDLPDFRVLAKCEWMNPGGSVKDRPVLRMLLEAILDGRLAEGKAILDSSSGNAGIAYAAIGAALGYEVHLVVPGNASAERKKRLAAHAAKVTYTDPMEGYDEALRTCRRMHEANPDRYFFCDQYANGNNPREHYESTGVEILDRAKREGVRITHFVAGVGTGGTITGVGRRLKEHDPSIRVVAIRPERFPGIEGLKPMGEPEDIVPAILDQSVIDAWVDVTADEAAEFCHYLARRGLFVGQSSGAYLAGVRKVGEKARKGTCVTLFSDLGERYFSAGLWD